MESIARGENHSQSRASGGDTPTTGNRLAKRGWLYKRGQKVKNWKKRWFEVDPSTNTLRYYDQENSPKPPLGTLELRNARILAYKECLDLIKKENCFALETADRILYIQEHDTTERNEWIRILTAVCQIANKGRVVSHGGTPVERVDPPRHSATGGGRGDGGRVQREKQQSGPWSPGTPFSHTQAFFNMRKHGVSMAEGGLGDQTRIRVRVTKLLNGKIGQFQSRQKFEESVVPWQKSTAPRCPDCRKEFGSMLSSAHKKVNCRLCGKITCSEESCSSMCNLNNIAAFLKVPPTSMGDVAVRVCTHCTGEVEKVNATNVAHTGASKLAKYYAVIVENKANVERLMQDFSAITSAKGSKLNAGEKLRMKEIREEIMKGFSLVQGAAQRIVALPESGAFPNRSPRFLFRFALPTRDMHACKRLCPRTEWDGAAARLMVVPVP
eukprot:m.328678 g.328678  ORF g.328678 m.328678 type:complete len:440 (-) comp20436_c1_seq4:53-1372(-)